jgi:hypothetical protein
MASIAVTATASTASTEAASETLMPTAALRPCAEPRCPALVTKGRCATHARQMEHRRGTAHARGYTYREWQPFRRRFLAALVEAGIVPVCGAALPTGPVNRDSACREAGRFTYTSADGSSLHLDHEPALEDWERQDMASVCDPNRIVLKCAQCHGVKTGGGR